MWKPSERIKHRIEDTFWPTPSEAEQSLLFSPIKMGKTLSLEQRTWVPAMVPWRATEAGEITPELLAWYGRFAQGRPGAIVVEATGIRDIPSGPLLRIGHSRFLKGLEQLVATIHEQSNGHTRVLIQLIDFLRIRRRPGREKFLNQFLKVTSAHRQNLARCLSDDSLLEATENVVRTHLLAAESTLLDEVLSRRELESLRFGLRERVTDMEQEHIRNLPQVLPELFAQAAVRAQSAGFDGVELHYAHAYTMASFLSRHNTRDDAYGGSREQRVRLPLEVYSAVRNAVGSDYCVGARYLCDEIIEGGNDVDDATWFGVEFARAGMDYLSLSTGGKFEDAKQPKVGWAAYPYTGQSGYECMPTVISDAVGPFGRQIPKQARIRAAIRGAEFDTPIVVAGGIHSFEQAESILQCGHGDIVAAARQSIADPDWFRKVQLGQGQSIRRCLFTNYCEALDQKHKQVTGQLWDKESLDEPGLLMSTDGKRRLTAPK
ncbi:MAG TPA: NADH:flavin oxidoreductase [Myxococcales bacterium]|nr:NADH:flavin oxidoreductase [Myxococcales bacterium]